MNITQELFRELVKEPSVTKFLYVSFSKNIPFKGNTSISFNDGNHISLDFQKKYNNLTGNNISSTCGYFILKEEWGELSVIDFLNCQFNILMICDNRNDTNTPSWKRCLQIICFKRKEDLQKIVAYKNKTIVISYKISSYRGIYRKIENPDEFLPIISQYRKYNPGDIEGQNYLSSLYEKLKSAIKRQNEKHQIESYAAIQFWTTRNKITISGINSKGEKIQFKNINFNDFLKKINTSFVEVTSNFFINPYTLLDAFSLNDSNLFPKRSKYQYGQKLEPEKLEELLQLASNKYSTEEIESWKLFGNIKHI